MHRMPWNRNGRGVENSAPARWEAAGWRSCPKLHVACTAGAVTIRAAEVLIRASASSLHPCLLPLTFFSFLFFFPSGGGGTGLAIEGGYCITWLEVGQDLRQ